MEENSSSSPMPASLVTKFCFSIFAEIAMLELGFLVVQDSDN